MTHRLIIQLARLGDLLQSLPAIASLRAQYPEDTFDLLCAAPLLRLGEFFPALGQVFPWDGGEWGQIAKSWSHSRGNALARAVQSLNRQQLEPYSMAYNLNNHPRAIVAAHLFAHTVTGPGCHGPLSSFVPDWMHYLTLVATHRGGNRVHLADAFCGLCGVMPPTTVPTLRGAGHEIDWPTRVSRFFSGNRKRVALVVGSGDADRRIPLRVIEQWMTRFLSACPDGQVILVGGAGERELSHILLDRIPSLYQGRIWDACAQTSLSQLASVLSRCDWVIGSDTGPLHLGVACGAKVQGFYFSRARVHETGPYGQGHWVWQADPTSHQQGSEGFRPVSWPVEESMEVLLTETCSNIPDGWSLWCSRQDEWGAHFIQYADPNGEPVGYREQIWQTLHSGKPIDWDSIAEMMRLSGSSFVLQSEV